MLLGFWHSGFTEETVLSGLVRALGMQAGCCRTILADNYHDCVKCTGYCRRRRQNWIWSDMLRFFRSIKHHGNSEGVVAFSCSILDSIPYSPIPKLIHLLIPKIQFLSPKPRPSTSSQPQGRWRAPCWVHLLHLRARL